MNKTFKGILCAGMCAAMLTTAACGGSGSGGSGLNTETRPLRLAIGALDKNFNPFFSTSLNDSDIAGMTQVSLITSDENGNEAYGENWPTVALDYTYRHYDASGNATTTGSSDGTTKYSFIIKNDMKFSDEEDLTIHDVLFNFYVYLDPAYDGSNTMYSTDIVGLKSYWAQQEIAEDSSFSMDEQFYAPARERISALKDWSKNSTSLAVPSELQDDYDTVVKLFNEEAASDWTNYETSWQESYKDYELNAAWEVYLYVEGIVSDQTEPALDEEGNVTTGTQKVKSDEGKYLTTLSPNKNAPNQGVVEAQHIIDDMNDYLEAYLDAYMAANPEMTEAECTAELQKEWAIALVVENYTAKTQIADVLTYWATATNALNAFAAEEKSAYYAERTNNGQLAIPNISGIRVSKTSSYFNGTPLAEEHDVLEITINGVDPKAVWNFAIPIAPMHYYSDAEYTQKANNDNTIYETTGANAGGSNFGVKMGDSAWFSNTLKTSDKNGVPVGAGPYKASTSTGGDPTRLTFVYNNVVYFERNEYFETMGAGINNAKIKYLRYRVTNDNQILTALKAENIDYGQPSATSVNLQEVNNTSFLDEVHYDTGGYGYIGINPKYVPDIEVRQAIMKAMNPNTAVTDYYKSASLARVIYRPMSTTSWAYPQNCTAYESVAYTTNTNEIIALVEAAGYTKFNSDGVRVNSNGDKLKFTFTIAGESDDHPAYQIFNDAEETLEKCGFDITVTTDIQALRKLNTGDLAVWAAAYTSTIDPDMYQLYHKDSKATSVNNWGYSTMLDTNNDNFVYERGIINELSEKIEEARSYMEQSDRKPIYSDCLDLVMELAVQLPTYQRNDLCVYNKNVIKKNSLNQKASDKMGPISKIWEVDYV